MLPSSPPNLYSFDSVDVLAENLRAYILDAQNQSLRRHNVFRLAISGGSLPSTVARALLAPSNGSQADTPVFSKWELFFADERCVALDHADSNYKLVKETLLDRIPAAAGAPRVFPIDTRCLPDVEETADRYEQALVGQFASRDSVRIPLFDLVLLGCGPDGHTCSLFPGSPLLRRSDTWVLSMSDAPKPPPMRITLSLPVASHGINIAFVVTGAGKREILRQIFDTEEGRKLPCGLINGLAGERVSWFCDGPAVEGLQFPRRKSPL